MAAAIAAAGFSDAKTAILAARAFASGFRLRMNLERPRLLYIPTSGDCK